ncbi:MAG: SHOCT domain-containing protein, partial [Candidatus Helarchaeota archaeon]|nr:SHOCT domain-containing protein [Candidatus Helarchaeota archaeon]
DQFLVYLYEDQVYNTYGVIFDQNFTYSSRPFEYGTRDRRSPTVSELLSLDEYVSGTINLTCNAVDEETGIDMVRFYWDDDPTFEDPMFGGDSVQFGYQNVSLITVPTYYQFEWDTSTFPSCYIFALASDDAAPVKNEKVSEAYFIQIDNVIPNLSQVVAYGPFREAINLYANTFDADSGVEYVEYWDGDPTIPGSTLLGIGHDSSSSFSFTWTTDPGGTDDGVHYICVRTYDRAGKYNDSALFEITVDSQAQVPSPATNYTGPIIIAGAIIGAAIVIQGLLRRSRSPEAPPPPSKKIRGKMKPPTEQTPLNTLKQRLAQGEITQKEYLSMKNLLEE